MYKNNLFEETFPFAALKVAQAGQFIKEIISDELKTLTPKEPKSPKSEFINIDGVVAILRERGYPIAKGSIYNLVSSKSIPQKKWGNGLYIDIDLKITTESYDK